MTADYQKGTRKEIARYIPSRTLKSLLRARDVHPVPFGYRPSSPGRVLAGGVLLKNPLEEESCTGLRQIFPGTGGGWGDGRPGGGCRASLDFGAALGIWAAICHIAARTVEFGGRLNIYGRAAGFSIAS